MRKGNPWVPAIVGDASWRSIGPGEMGPELEGASDIELFRKEPYPGGVGAKLSAIPLKRNMQDPANQEDAKNAWAAYRARLGAPWKDLPKGYQDNLTRASRELGRKYWGMPEERILELTGNDLGVRGDLNYLQYDEKPAGLPDAFLSKDGQTIVMPSLEADQKPQRRFGTLVHEIRHRQAKQDYPTFKLDAKRQRGAKNLDAFGNQPVHFPPATPTDREMAEALEAEGLARDFGGYPSDIRPRSPWRK